MPRILMVVSSAREIALADGRSHPTGFWAEEVLKPYRRFVAAGVEVSIYTPDGKPPRPDPYGLEPKFHYADEDEDFLAAVTRSFAPDPEDVRLTLHHLTELNLIAARRVFGTLLSAGVQRPVARSAIEGAAKRAWREDRDFIEVLASDAAVVTKVDREGLHALARAGHEESVAAAKAVADALAAIPALKQPGNLAKLTDAEVLQFDAVFFPGGHGPMADLSDNPDVRRVLGLMHGKGRTIAALCHGPAALLSAGEVPESGWLFDGYKLTGFTDEEEDQTPLGEQGAPWYLAAALKNKGAVFEEATHAWSPHVVADRNLITAQNPASSEAAADAILKKLGVAIHG